MEASATYIARKLFQLSVYSKNGQEFENFFCKVMRHGHKGFTPVKPRGKFGDRKNDGFIKEDGKYYQVYSPENPKGSVNNAIKKLYKDFNGLHSYWNVQVTPIREFYFVLNDKYQGAFPELHLEMKKIEDAYDGVKCFPFFAANLEDIFLSLDDEAIIDVLGPIIVPEELQAVDNSVLHEVVKYLLGSEIVFQMEKLPDNPNFSEKIAFNGLSSYTSNLLRQGSYLEGYLKDYFSINSGFAKNDLRNVFNSLYKKAQDKIPPQSDKSDLVFLEIMRTAYPNHTVATQPAIIALMSYFFAYCDIFEEPVLLQA